MIPIPAIIYNQITFPLQLLASRMAAFWLELLSAPVLRDGNVLALLIYSMEVLEAYSGIRSLVTSQRYLQGVALMSACAL
jgi:hypothetical protein